MGPLYRTRSRSIASTNFSQPSTPAQHTNAQRQPEPPAPPSSSSTPSLQVPGMSPTFRYTHNLKVLRRRDPSIVSIFDQFSHVCVYHHNGVNWEKNGYEGSMFLFERDSYPPYGFYILNRMGTDDYIQRLYPEDDIGAHGSYLMLRAYPDFTARRLAAVGDLPDKFDRRYTLQNIDQLSPENKGRSQTRGLWMFASDSRGPMISVMLRLHSYIKRNLPYPEEYRHAPDRPPPVNSSAVSGAAPASQHASRQQAPSAQDVDPEGERSMDISRGDDSYITPHSIPPVAAGRSEVDKLFARLSTNDDSSPSASSAPTTVEDLFAGFSANAASQSHVAMSSVQPTPPPVRGLALLNSIFASASTPSVSNAPPSSSMQFPDPPSAPPSTRFSEALPVPTVSVTQIISPKPRPQILNQDVISSLMGLSGSRSSSAASSRHSGVYQGDNERSDSNPASDEDSAYSESSTVLDAEADMEVQAAGSSSGLPLLAPQNHVDQDCANGAVLGDETPRPPLRSELETISPPQTAVASLPRPGLIAMKLHSANVLQGRSTLPAAPPEVASVMSAPPTLVTGRPLVPFEADSELWPYPRAPVDDRADDIVELDFSDTSALSDPAKFAQKAGKRRKGKKGKKEMDEERQRERDEIEQSWDVPVPVNPSTSAATPLTALLVPKTNGKVASAPPAHPTPATGSTSSINGAQVSSPLSTINVDVARSALVNAAAVRLQESGQRVVMEKKEFIREILALIHTKPDFADELWRSYTARVG